MRRDEHVSPAFATSNNNNTRYAPYNTLLASSASASSASVWSDTTSHSSDDTSLSANASDSDSCDAYCVSKHPAAALSRLQSFRPPTQQHQIDAVPIELRQNPRRSSVSSAVKAACPPPLVRQSHRKGNFVDSLVDSSTQIVEAIWPLSSVPCRSELGSKAVLPLRTFIQETLRRSRTSYSTLQVALYYLILIKPHVPRHNFTTEQPSDKLADRALQCGRRMFLSALILASKYLQDRNYSARAWSKISGLNTLEINQNEIAFLLAVNWRLHISDEVFQRWSEIVLKYTPPPTPPSPGGASQVVAQQAADWKQIILKLDPDMSNIEGLIPIPQFSSKTSDLCVLSPRSILNFPLEVRSVSSSESLEATPTPRSCATPATMEPITASTYTPGRLAPALGLLPTPRLTPQTRGFCTPAVSAASHILGKSNAMGLAMAQANSVTSAQHLDRMPLSVTSSPQGYATVRRSSLANSVSTASSPESMISDTSCLSRSSSISSSSSLASATLNCKLGLPSRFRAAKLMNERASQKPTVPSVPEDFDEPCLTSSPESYTGPVSKLGDLSLDTPLARREHELERMVQDPESDAARALQRLHNQSTDNTSTVKTGCKRGRSMSLYCSVQDNVRDILNDRHHSVAPAWSDSLVRARRCNAETRTQIPVISPKGDTRKRMCCSTEAANGYEAAMSLQRPGMWNGILN